MLKLLIKEIPVLLNICHLDRLLNNYYYYNVLNFLWHSFSGYLAAHIHHVIERLQLGENPQDVWFNACKLLFVSLIYSEWCILPIHC